MCSADVFCLLYPSEQWSAEAILPISSAWYLAWLLSFKYVCSGLLVKWDPLPPLPKWRTHRSLLSGDRVWVGVCAGLGEKRLPCWDWDNPKKGSFTEMQGMGLVMKPVWMSVSAMSCSPKVALFLCLRKWLPARFFVPGDVSLWKLPLRDTLWKEQIILQYLPQAFF